MDFGWRFAFGHATDPSRDFGHATGQFSYFAKAGYGAGASAPEFDDRGWRALDLPHDWAVEVPFDPRGSGSHGFKAVGPNFPETSVGWYRKAFTIPASDLGRRIRVEFDGVFRDSIAWINGHYLGTEESGYSGFGYDLSDFLNYGGTNVLAVRVDATLEEGWFYEGAGIYRHAWLVKTDPVHVPPGGTFVTSEIRDGSAAVTARVSISNEGTNPVWVDVDQAIVDADGTTRASTRYQAGRFQPGVTGTYTNRLELEQPRLWSIETPFLYTLVTVLRSGGAVVDRYETPFGIRAIRFDPDSGFFLNGKRLELKGTDNHQDHAGVGVALPDALQDFRIAQLKKIGCNAYRCSHNPPTPELLEACDRLGMMVIDENRLMGTTEFHLDHLRRMILRDRNHPCVVLWSLGNEEWRMEGNEVGRRITAAMQAYVKRLDTTRPCTVAISGGWGRGSSMAIEVAGFNYIGNGDTDQQHARRPEQPIVGTEECAFNNTRGVYQDDRANGHLRAYDWDPSRWGSSAEEGWTHYAGRPWLAGMFVWTGFDYRGEPTPFGWPAVSSQFGILDTCGFPKDAFSYFKAWWTDEPLVHVFPHWNWPGREGQSIPVWVYGNCEEIELSLNGTSLGRKSMPRNSHLEWQVAYAPGTLLARGFTAGREMATDRVETTGDSTAIQLLPDRKFIRADAEDVAVIAIQVNDREGRRVPTAGNEIRLAVAGPGRIIGVGNGDPSSHEPDRIVEPAGDWKRSVFNGWAQVIVQSTSKPGKISVTANGAGLQSCTIEVRSESATLRPAVP